jgi:hypothetical protein
MELENFAESSTARALHSTRRGLKEYGGAPKRSGSGLPDHTKSGRSPVVHTRAVPHNACGFRSSREGEDRSVRTRGRDRVCYRCGVDAVVCSPLVDS